MTAEKGKAAGQKATDAESEIDFLILAADNVESLRQAVRILLATVRDLSLLLSSLRSEVDSLRGDMTRLQSKLDESAGNIEREVINRTSREWTLIRIAVGVILAMLLLEVIFTGTAIFLLQ